MERVAARCRCGQKMMVKPTSVGKFGRCAGCGERVQVERHVDTLRLVPVKLKKGKGKNAPQSQQQPADTGQAAPPQQEASPSETEDFASDEVPEALPDAGDGADDAFDDLVDIADDDNEDEFASD